MKTLVKCLFVGGLFVAAAFALMVVVQPADAFGNCPLDTCPGSMYGWSQYGACTDDTNPDVPVSCRVYINDSTGYLCKDTSNCNPI